ncbi:MAG: Hsp20 family protein [Rhodospirillales bacterium]|nr:Hsp20 family protein [Rhodospirillales bacterium]
MRNYDLSPLLRASVGFDRLMTMLDSAARAEDAGPSYPPYNIEKLDQNRYRISMAVSGFAESELEITAKEQTLIVTGRKAKAEPEAANFLYRGIAQRAFERRFDLADHIKVTGASLENGLLHIELIHEIPEAKKPRAIAIHSGVQPDPKAIEGNKQAA